MNNEEINRAMAKIAGKCWHETTENVVGCMHCGEVINLSYKNRQGIHVSIYNPNYCSDLNLVREVELKLVEEGLELKYYNNLRIELYPLIPPYFNFITADAKTRCLAIIKTKGG